MLLEAVPNLSLGPQDTALESVLAWLEEQASPGWALLDTHTDVDHRRTVLTLAGAPAPLTRVLSGLGKRIEAEASLQGHTGVHPRVGLLDVLPIVPLSGARWQDARRTALQLAHRFAGRGIPVYRYAKLQADPARSSLATIRGHVEFFGRTETPVLPPDLGPEHLHPRMGACCIGVRSLLIAYNVLLDTDDLEQGRAIAGSLRPANGGLAGVQALAFPLASQADRVQVSTNITDAEATTPADVYAAVQERAERSGIEVLSGELVGLAPTRALPADPAAMGLQARPESLEDRLRAHGFPPDTQPA